jgi:hypothetical protein
VCAREVEVTSTTESKLITLVNRRFLFSIIMRLWLCAKELREDFRIDARPMKCELTPNFTLFSVIAMAYAQRHPDFITSAAGAGLNGLFTHIKCLFSVV